MFVKIELEFWKLIEKDGENVEKLSVKNKDLTEKYLAWREGRSIWVKKEASTPHLRKNLEKNQGFLNYSFWNYPSIHE